MRVLRVALRARGRGGRRARGRGARRAPRTSATGCMVCVPVPGPWVVVPASDGLEPRAASSSSSRARAGHIVGGLDARLSVRGIDVQFLGKLGSPVNPGITTSRSAVFLGDVRRAAAIARRRSSPFIGCMPASGGGARVPTSVTAFRPGQPVTRRVKTVRVRPGTTTVVQRCASERAPRGRVARVRVRHAQRPRARASCRAFPARRQIGSRGVVVSVRGDAELAGVRALVQVQALCARVAMSFKSPWLLLGLLVLAIAIGLWILADRRRARYTVRYTNLDVLATVVSGRSWLRYVPSGARRARPGRAPRRPRATGGDADRCCGSARR